MATTTNFYKDARALADLADYLFLLLVEELSEPDTRQKQAIYLISEAWQHLYAASINLTPYDEVDPDSVGDNLDNYYD